MKTVEPRTAIEYCHRCGLTLPLCSPGPGERSMTWYCTGCGTSYEAVLEQEPSPDRIQNVRPARLRFRLPRGAEFPKAIAEFVARMVPEKAHPGAQKRALDRYPVVTPIAVMPLGDRLELVGETFMAVTKNISGSGLALVCTRAVRARYLAVEILEYAREGIQVVVHVLRCRPVRCFYEIAGRFVTRMLESSESLR